MYYHRNMPLIQDIDNWLRDNQKLLVYHQGKRIAIHPIKGIIASEDNFEAVYDQVKELNLLDDVVFHSVL